MHFVQHSNTTFSKSNSTFRICFHVHSLLIISMSPRKFFSSWTIERKNFVLSHGRKNSSCSVAMCFQSFVTSFDRMGTLCARNVWTWVRVLNDYNLRKKHEKNSRMKLFHTKFIKIIVFSCAPDWHSKQRHVSYIIWILVFGFVIPTIIIVISTVITFVNMHKVIFQAHVFCIKTRLSTFLIFNLYHSLYLNLQFFYSCENQSGHQKLGVDQSKGIKKHFDWCFL